MRRAVFVDTSAIFAFLVTNDEHHNAGEAAINAATGAGERLVITNVVMFECYTLLRSRANQALAHGFLDDIADGAFVVARVNPEDESQAQKILRRQSDKSYSFCDALSFAVMERLCIDEVITFDDDFTQYGRFVVR